MVPLREYGKSWSVRPTNGNGQSEPYRKYFILCEGENTERWYFEKFIDLKKYFGISSLLSIEYLEKTEEHKSWSNPSKLFELADRVRKGKKYAYDANFDKIIIVFDADIYESQDRSVYDNLVAKASSDNIICVTNPSFELFLLLHYANSYGELIAPNAGDILQNGWVNSSGQKSGNKKDRMRYIEYLFRKKSGLMPKSDPRIADLVKDIAIAIEQEKKLNNDILDCRGKLTSNIGVVISKILAE